MFHFRPSYPATQLRQAMDEALGEFNSTEAWSWSWESWELSGTSWDDGIEFPSPKISEIIRNHTKK